jgi:hypothetical protein
MEETLTVHKPHVPDRLRRTGFRRIPLLPSSMANAVSKTPVAKRAAVA